MKGHVMRVAAEEFAWRVRPAAQKVEGEPWSARPQVRS